MWPILCSREERPVMVLSIHPNLILREETVRKAILGRLEFTPHGTPAPLVELTLP